jgi:hypothetical protein
MSEVFFMVGRGGFSLPILGEFEKEVMQKNSTFLYP